MTTELSILVWTLVLALLQIAAAAVARNGQYGMKWNAGPRDEAMPPLKPLPGRLARAQANLFETLPLFIAALLVAHLAGREGGLTTVGAWFYLVARIVYVPLYAFGVFGVRSLAWMVSTVGLVLILLRLLGAA
jgi:uncharacterized MAPEG superfamily protein